MPVVNLLEALCLPRFSANNACFTPEEPSSKRVGGVWTLPKAAKATLFVASHSAERRQSYSKHSC